MLRVALLAFRVLPVLSQEPIGVSDDDCSLAGVCQPDGSCLCDAAFKGDKCVELNLEPTDPTQLDAYNLDARSSSWGGNAIYAEEDKKWHLFASEMVNECRTAYWATNSAVIHAVADKPEGPYTRRGVVLEAFHHNPSIAKAPDGTYLLYAIGDGTEGGKIVPKDCRQVSASPPAALGVEHDYAPQTGIINLYYSKSIYGPWKLLPGPILKGRPGKWDEFVTNPSVHVFSNGTVLMTYRGGNSTVLWHVAMAVAPHWRGPYTRASDQPVFTETNEDPSVFRDARGNFHMLTHYFATTTGHAFSRDGLNWRFAGSAFNHTLNLTNKSTLQLDHHERPQVLTLEGEPAYLFTGIVVHGDLRTHTLVQAFKRRANIIEV